MAKIILVLSIALNVYASDLEKMLKIGNSSFSMTGPSSISTQTRGYVTLGGISTRNDFVGVIRPFQIQLPSIHSGCGGIDINLGGFSFLSMEQLGEKLKAIMSAAPTFVFQMGLSVLCKDCQAIMNEIENIADIINGINFDSCKAAVNWGRKIGDVFSDKLKSKNDTYDGVQNTMNNFTSSFKEFNKKLKTGTGTVQSWLDGTVDIGSSNDANTSKNKVKIKYSLGSLINYALEYSDGTNKGISNFSDSSDTLQRYLGDLLKNKQDIEKFLRALLGDIYGYFKCERPAQSQEEVASVVYQTIAYSANEDEIISLFFGDANTTNASGFIEFPGIKITDVESINDDCSKGLIIQPKINFNSPVLVTKQGLKKQIIDNLTQIVNSLKKENETLSTQQLSSIDISTYPIYTAINIVSYTDDYLLLNYIAEFMIANDLIYAIREFGSKMRLALSYASGSDKAEFLVEKRQEFFIEMQKRTATLEKAAAQKLKDSAAQMIQRATNTEILSKQQEQFLKNEINRGIHNVISD